MISPLHPPYNRPCLLNRSAIAVGLLFCFVKLQGGRKCSCARHFDNANKLTESLLASVIKRFRHSIDTPTNGRSRKRERIRRVFDIRYSFKPPQKITSCCNYLIVLFHEVNSRKRQYRRGNRRFSSVNCRVSSFVHGSGLGQIHVCVLRLQINCGCGSERGLNLDRCLNASF